MRDDDTDEGMDDRTGTPTGCPEVTTMAAQPPTSSSDLHIVLPVPTDVYTDEIQVPVTTTVHEEAIPALATMEGFPMTTSVDETQVPATTVCKEAVPAPATMEGSAMSTSALPTDMPLPEDPPQLSIGPAPKKWKVAAHAIISNTISDK